MDLDAFAADDRASWDDRVPVHVASPDCCVAALVDDPSHLSDVVCTSVGVLSRLDDIDRWAAAVAGLLAPGGRLHLRHMHPSLWPWEGVDGQPALTYPCVTPRLEPLTSDEQATSVEGDERTITHTRQHEWNHPLPEVVTAVAGAGLRIDRLAEHDGLEWPALPGTTLEGAQWFLPEPLRGTVPAIGSLWASAPASGTTA